MASDIDFHSTWPAARRVCVIGAGTMGSGIACHLANIGFDVSLLDLTAESVHEAFEKAKVARPPHLYVPETADRIRLGSIRDNLDWAAEADWVCEAIVEKMDAKRELFQRLDGLISPHAMITTNTSGLQIGLLAQGFSETFRSRFMGTHFFNPPRYLKLLELIPTDATDPEAVEAMTRFLEERVARRVVAAKDTPGFIANRFGMWAMIHAIHIAERLRLTVEQVDAITGPFLGRPRSASFRLNDIVGLDIMQDIAQNLYERCPSDPHRVWLETPRSMTTLLSRGWIGDKAGQGYYRKEGRELVALDLNTFSYRMKQDVEFTTLTALSKQPLGQRVSAALDLRDEAGEFLRHHLIPVLQYAHYLKEEISHNVLDFDRVMMWGFGWEQGPFAMIDSIGHERLGLPEGNFYRSGEVRDFSGVYVSVPQELDYRGVKDYPVIESRPEFNIRDLGDGISAICLTTKMGKLTPSLTGDLYTLFETRNFGRFVLTSEARSFCVGFDLEFFLAKALEEDYASIESTLVTLQNLTKLLNELPCVAAVFGHCLGGGMELAMSCSAVAVHAEAQLGLPEAKVGVIPAAGGTSMMRLRAQGGGIKALADLSIQLTMGQVSVNADDARKLGYLRSSDLTVYHPDRLITEAKALARQVDPVPLAPWIPTLGPLAGMIDRAQEERKARGEMSDYDETIGDKIKSIFSKSSSFEEALDRERGAFIDLIKHALTHARIKHMLESGKPLRN